MKTKRVIAVLLLLIVGSGIAVGQISEDPRDWFKPTPEDPVVETPPSMEELQAEFLIEGAKYFRTMRAIAVIGLMVAVLVGLFGVAATAVLSSVATIV